MRSLAFIALGTFAATGCLFAQALSEHAAAAAGATIGTAAGKPLGTALGKIFGDINKDTSNAAGAKPAKRVQPKIVKPSPATPTSAASLAGEPRPSSGSFGSEEGGSAPARHTRRHASPAPLEPIAAPEAPIIPVIAEPVVKQPTIDEVAAVRIGENSNDVETALGAPESRVSIPDDDGHLIEINQYWANGQPLGTIRLDNGRVVSVQARGY
ncbi:MAG TPA: hypothetical protein VME17_19075 [Bryobacteraceae bacterium]|nr:hypothetical protein [Bryobacteraceae bacterium]